MQRSFTLPNLADLVTPEDHTRAFCSLIARIITHAIKNIPVRACIETLEEMQEKYRLARTVLTGDQIIRKVGHTLRKWAKPIRNHDENFFFNTSLESLISDSLSEDSSPPPDSINEENRRLFQKSLTRDMRDLLMDVLEHLLVIYARYVQLQPE